MSEACKSCNGFTIVLKLETVPNEPVKMVPALTDVFSRQLGAVDVRPGFQHLEQEKSLASL